jgi:hypothetical protein
LGFGRCTLNLYAIGWADRGKILICPTTQQGAGEIFGDRGSAEIQTEQPIDGIHLMATDGIPRSKSVVNFSKAKYSWFLFKQLPLPHCLGEKNWKDAGLVSPRERARARQRARERKSESERVRARQRDSERARERESILVRGLVKSLLVRASSTIPIHLICTNSGVQCALGTTETWHFALRWT